VDALRINLIYGYLFVPHGCGTLHEFVRAFRITRNPRTIVKAGTVGPLITQITLIVDARNVRMARACGVAAQGLTNEETDHKVEEVK
jgi:hypothetical protein